MKKLKLFGIKKENRRAEFILEKSQNFIPIIQKIIKKITGKFDWDMFITTNEKTGGCVNEKIKNWTDKCKYKKYQDYEFDIFIGKSKIILVVRSNHPNQKKFIKELLTFYKFENVK